ncbi:hypothetical protein FJZ31_05920 [Candidatus Poribacteria bacterium]|nr:hypothetical protein [Candidatus Poribacteria bacterium]
MGDSFFYISLKSASKTVLYMEEFFFHFIPLLAEWYKMNNENSMLHKKIVSKIDRIYADALDYFFAGRLISDVVRAVKSGKEATVFCCRAHPSLEVELLAAKVYRRGQFHHVVTENGEVTFFDQTRFSNFKNDAMYREGRTIDRRLGRAIQKRTRKAREVEHTSWIEQEFETLSLLYNAGADVPRPFAQSETAILMEYIGDEQSPAPILRDVILAPEEVEPLFELLFENIKIWLACNRVHADLSPYNILYWNGALKIIDFPQSVDPRINQNACALLQRDIKNICHYWARYGIRNDALELANDLYDCWLRQEL